MKKLALILSVAIMVVTSVMPAFAQVSPDVKTVVTVKSAEDVNGNKIVIGLRELEGKNKDLADEILKPNNLKALLGDDYSDKLQVVDTVDMYVWDSKKGEISWKDAKELFPVTITFNVPGVTPKSNVKVLAYYDGAWHVVDGLTVGNGTVKGAFDVTMPLIFLVDGKKVSGVDIKSPKTGESNMGMYITILAAAAFAGVVVSRKKKTA